MPDLEVIVALSENYVIGKKGQIPWHLSEDLKRFRQITSGHIVVMGRNTFESIGKILPNRTNILISSTFDRKEEGLMVMHSLDEALDFAGEKKLLVIGGARLYEEALPRASVLHLTRIKKFFEGDALFPRFEHYPFRLTASEHCYSEQNGFHYDFETWSRD